MRRLVILIAGLTGLGLLLLGAPLILWTVGKDLLPDHVPSLGEIWDVLLGPDTGRLFLGALVVIGTIAWVIMAAAIVLEIPAALTGRSMPRIRGLGWAQRTASVLLFMIITGTVTSTMTAAQALPPLPTAPISMAAASSAHPAADGSAEAAPVTHHTAAAAAGGVKLLTGKPLPAYTVQAGDTPWSIAEKTLGSGERASEIVALNTGRTQVDGGALTATTFPRPGWVLRLPADARITDLPTPEPSPSTSPSTGASVAVLVQPGDTLSGIAQRELGDAAAYPELAAVNHLPDPDDILAGSTIVIPANSPPAAPAVPVGDRAVQVQPGDTLSGIAQRELGDAAAYPELAAVNHLADPDIIDAGSTIVIPTDQSQQCQPPPAPSTLPPVDTAAAPPAPTGDPTTSAPTSASAATDGAARTADAAPHVAGELAAVGAGSLSTPSTGESAPSIPVLSPQQAESAAERPPQDGPTGETSSTEEVNAVALIGLSAAAAAALWAGLLAARRRHHRGRRPGRQAPTVDLAAVRTEKRLRERANDVDVAWLDLALRSLGTVLSGHPGPVPDITAAYLGPPGLRLQLAAEQPAPDPFVTDGTTWWLPAAADLPITAAGAVDQMTPLPTLTSIGTLGAETVLVDLERLGSVGLQGDQDACRALITHMAVELAHQSWSDGVIVTLVGWGRELVPLNPDRLTYSGSVQDISRALESRVRDVSAALVGLDTDIVSARARDIAGDSWTPQVLLIDATGVDPADLDALHAQVSALTEAGRVATAVVMTGGPPPAAPVAKAVLTADGKLSVPAILGTEHIAAAALTGDDLDGLLALFANAEGGDVPIPPSVLDEPWATHMDDSGALIPPVVMDEPVQVWAAAQHATADAAGPETPPPAAAREVSAADLTRLSSVLADDPTLDDDLTEWHSDVVRRPRIALLGPARITAAGETPNRLTWFTQVAVYLALHRDGVTLEKFTADLWPAPGRPGQARAIATSTRNETAFKVRRWMGTHPDTGAPFVPMGTDKYYRLNDRLLDSELLQRLRKRGDAKVAAGDPTAIDDYLTALKLVRGRVLPEASGTGWGWLANADRREDLNVPAMVVDAAHRAVQVALTAGDLDRARWAANLAHDTDPHSDVPLLDLLVIAAQAGDMATANRHAWEVVWANDKEVPEELPTETFQVINRIFPAGLQSVNT